MPLAFQKRLSVCTRLVYGSRTNTRVVTKSPTGSSSEDTTLPTAMCWK